jgi:hypothetical protein
MQTGDLGGHLLGEAFYDPEHSWQVTTFTKTVREVRRRGTPVTQGSNEWSEIRTVLQTKAAEAERLNNLVKVTQLVSGLYLS